VAGLAVSDAGCVVVLGAGEPLRRCQRREAYGLSRAGC